MPGQERAPHRGEPIDGRADRATVFPVGSAGRACLRKRALHARRMKDFRGGSGPHAPEVVAAIRHRDQYDYRPSRRLRSRSAQWTADAQGAVFRTVLAASFITAAGAVPLDRFVATRTERAQRWQQACARECQQDRQRVRVNPHMRKNVTNGRSRSCQEISAGADGCDVKRSRRARIGFVSHSWGPLNRATSLSPTTSTAAGSALMRNALNSDWPGSSRRWRAASGGPWKNCSTVARSGSWLTTITFRSAGGEAASPRSCSASARQGAHHVAQNATNKARAGGAASSRGARPSIRT